MIKEIIHNVYTSLNSNAVFTGIGERSREGQELYSEMKESNLLDKMSMVYGQMGDNPVSRSKAVYTGLTTAEYLRDEKKQDVLLFIDNIYRFIQAKAEIATELKQILIGNGYPSDMASEMSKIEERINSNQNGSITSVQAIYIPADDLTDESVQTIMSYMDGQIVLDRKIAELGIYPAINVFNSSSKLVDVEKIGEIEGYDDDILIAPWEEETTLREDTPSDMLDPKKVVENAPTHTGNYISVPLVVGDNGGA